MAFREFSFPDVVTRFGLKARDAVLFPDATDYPLRAEFESFVRAGLELAVASGTEKARSDFVVGPVLLEFRRTVGERVKVFSGVDWAVDPDKGLNGVCDFILTTGSSSHILEAPFLAIAEAKNDQIRTGFGQCFAAMVAAQMANESAGLKPRTIYGVVTTGAIWQFNRLSGNELTIDGHEYSLDRLARVMGILHAIAASK